MIFGQALNSPLIRWLFADSHSQIRNVGQMRNAAAKAVWPLSEPPRATAMTPMGVSSTKIPPYPPATASRGMPARLDPVEIGVDIELQQIRRMIARPAGRPRRNPVKPQAAKIELIDKNIDHPHRVVVTDSVFQPLGKQKVLRALHLLDKTLHQTLPPKHGRIIAQETHSTVDVFTQPGPTAEVKITKRLPGATVQWTVPAISQAHQRQ